MKKYRRRRKQEELTKEPRILALIGSEKGSEEGDASEEGRRLGFKEGANDGERAAFAQKFGRDLLIPAAGIT